MPLPKPIGRQKEVLYLPAKGHVVVIGTAGSGKTTLAMLRAKYLMTAPDNPGRTLLVTFNRMLSTFLQTVAPGELAGVDVRNYHHFARGYLQHRGKLPPQSIIDYEPRAIAIRTAMKRLQRRHPEVAILDAASEAIAEEFAWIARMGLQCVAEYESVADIERGGLLISDADRQFVWEAYEEYQRVREDMGYQYDWDDLGAAALEEFEADKSQRMYTHVVIDEGQDFSPVMLRSLVAAVPRGGSITFFGDAAQQIYGSRISWRDAGLKVPDGVVHFEENYRNTRQIADFALSIASGPYFKDVVDLVRPKAPKAAGVKPAIVRFRDEEAERDFVINQAAQMAQTQSVAVLLRDRSKEAEYIAALRKSGVGVRRLHKTTPRWRSAPGAWVGTYHAGKGLEFDSVLLPHVSANVIPDRDRIVAIGNETTAYAEEARLLYVAVTRAKARLILTYAGTLTPLLANVTPSLFVHEDRR